MVISHKLPVTSLLIKMWENQANKKFHVHIITRVGKKLKNVNGLAKTNKNINCPISRYLLIITFNSFYNIRFKSAFLYQIHTQIICIFNYLIIIIYLLFTILFLFQDPI